METTLQITVPIGKGGLGAVLKSAKEQYEEFLRAHKEFEKEISLPPLDESTIFRDIIQYEDKEKLLKRLHELIDGHGGAEVGAVLLQCLIRGYITRKPTQKEFISEFQLKGTWQGIFNYMEEGNNNALDRARHIRIFD